MVVSNIRYQVQLLGINLPLLMHAYLWIILKLEFLKNQEIQPWTWLRYIGDIFFIWTGNETQLVHFMDKVNSYHPNLKFTVKWSQ